MMGTRAFAGPRRGPRSKRRMARWSSACRAVGHGASRATYGRSRRRATTLIVRLDVSDAAVREASVRVAYYVIATGRSRQLASSDSAPVTASQRLTVAVRNDPPGGAVSSRVRVLARLVDPAGRSSDDAVTAVLRVAHGSARPFGSFSSRLLE